ncbi:XisH protein [Candidatus Thiomargarita nelsonii]|uniref:XisH protein n=1 Tax=Candidatus Thiomargarita nelsonii TaxID=1003181 RepID=A0A176S277_9GAMM|nr:XisH protein [Candidatus Thiomargarita nelsonii]
MKIGKKTLYADIGAERLISAEKGLQKIIVEIKSFVGHSEIYDLQQALGQYIMRRFYKNNSRNDYFIWQSMTSLIRAFFRLILVN